MRNKTKNKIKWAIAIPSAIIMLVTVLVTFFFPAIIAIWTLDWWYLMLFMVSWLPTLAELIAFTILIDAFKRI